MDVTEMVKVLEGQANEAELNTFSHWMAESEIHRHEFSQVRQLWQITQVAWPMPMDQRPLMRVHKQVKARQQKKIYTRRLLALTGVLMFYVITWWLWPTSANTKSSDETLTFDHITLKEVASHLEKRFDIQIQIKGPALEACVFTGSFSKASTINDVMHAISLSLKVNVADSRTGYEWRGLGC
jgi:ferric-dicitrate binding protein FerR (iron transport regulator)